jgi:tetratricopeptide (TPR) repeat protein
MRRLAIAAVASITLARAAAPAYACLWDHDTLAEESLGQKDTLEVVTGKLRDHATAWYEAKIAYTQPMIDKGDAPMERYDDLAVALAKTGKLDDAIALMTAKEARFRGEYTTEANLGTFYAMKGDTKTALDHLHEAIAINPDAHFGRETYQVQLLAWTDPDRTGDFLALPQPTEEEILSIISPTRTYDHVRAPAVPKDAVTAIVGLIRFGGNDQNAHLWYSLGLALAWQGHKNLAIRALWRADQLGEARAGALLRVVAMGAHPVEEAAMRHHEDVRDEAADEAASDWAAGERWERAREDAEVALAAKHPKKAFGY